MFQKVILVILLISFIYEGIPKLHAKPKITIDNAKTAKLSIEYTEEKQPAKLTTSLHEAIIEVLAQAGIEVVNELNADLKISIKASAQTYSQGYRGGVKLSKAYSKFFGELKIEHSNGFKFFKFVSGKTSPPFSISIFPGNKEKTGWAKASDATKQSDVIFTLLRFIHQNFGPEHMVIGLDSKNAFVAGATIKYLTKSTKTRNALLAYIEHDDPEIRRLAVKLGACGNIKKIKLEKIRVNCYLYTSWNRTIAPFNIKEFSKASLKDVKEVFLIRPKMHGGRVILPSKGKNGRRPKSPYLPRHRDHGKDYGPSMQERATFLLANLGKPGIEFLIRQLKKESEKRNGYISHLSWALARTGDPGRKALLALTYDKNKKIRLAAIKTLSLMGGTLDNINLEGIDKKILEQVREKIELRGLLNKLKHEDVSVRRRATKNLIGLRDSRVLEPLFEALQDKDKKVSEAASTALGIFGDYRALPKIVARFGRHHYATRKAAQRISAFGKKPQINTSQH